MAAYISPIGGFVVIPIKNQFSYLFRYDKLIQSLRVKVERLDAKRADLQLRVDAARRNLQVIDSGVQEWLKRVEKIKQDLENLVGAVPEDQNGSCLNVKCPKPKLRYSQSRQAMNLTAAVIKLLKKFDKFQKISYPSPPLGIEAIPPPSGTHEFQSRKDIEEEIMAFLRNDTIFMIGVCGMGGVGKTTMAKKICRRAREEQLFDEIVMTEGLGQDADQLKIQQQIAGGLGLELTKDTRTNCSRLLQRLTGKNVLLVLDDVWERLDLEELGIPSQSMNEGCKIILTTRNDRVCIESTKDGKRNLSLEVLREEETWSLFRDKAGSVVDQEDLRELAIDVAKECKGLPVALATVGIALRERTNIAVWKDALSELQHALPTNIPGVLEDVYQPLQLSYKALKSPEARYLFLICCLFPEDSRIDLEDLVHYGIGLRIFSNIGNLREARNRVCVLVENLKSRFLLMDATYNVDYPRVKMHDVVRDMAIWISSKGTEHVLFKVSHDIGLIKWPIKDSCENYTSISLTFGPSIVNIPECMNCPKLKALIVDCNRNYSDEAPKLPDTFFNGMRDLRLLSISYCIVPSSSLSLLTQLRVLRLSNCGLKKMISFIGEFVNLEILSLIHSDIEVLPHEMGALTKLKVLNLTHCGNLEKIAPGVISRLVQLEELRLLDSPIEWEGGEEKGKERSNASVVEVFSLRNLRALDIWIKDPQVIPHDRGGQLGQELTSYVVIIGESHPLIYTDYQKGVVVNVNEMGKSFVNSMCVLFMGAEHLHLRGKGSKDIIEVLERQGFQNVKRLDLSGMDDLEEICDAPPPVGSFSKLEEIHLRNLPRLMYLWKCSNEKFCLPNLKKINIYDCEKLKWVFPLSIAESLCQLETIDIWDGPNMEEVFFKDEIRGSSEEGGDSDHMNIKFPKLKELKLQYLPKLSALCKAVDVFEFPSITKLEISEVSWFNKEMMISFIGEFVNLEVLRLWDSDIEVLPDEIGALTKLKVLDLTYCYNLKKIAPGVISRLVQLEKLRLLECPIEWEERSNASVVEVFSLRNLRTLEIWIKDPQVIPQDRGGQLGQELRSYHVTIGESAPDLSTYEKCMGIDVDEMRKCFVNSMRVLLMGAEDLYLRGKGSKHIIEVLERQGFQNVKKLEIYSLDTAKHLASTIQQGAIFPVLRRLHLSHMKDLEEICDAPPPVGSFSKLEEIHLRNLPRLMYLWKCSNEKLCLPNLKKINIYDCEKLKWVFPLSIAESLCQLETIEIKYCPNMEEVFFKDEIRQGSSEEEGGDDSDHMNIKFPKLKEMILQNLPKLSALCKAGDVFKFPSTITLQISEVPWWNLKMLGSLGSDLFNKEVPYIDSKSMIQIDVFTGLHKLSISYCSELRTLFSSDAFKSLINLKELSVSNCLILEEIFEKQNDEEKVLNLPQLESLELSELPKIRCFCNFKNTLELPSLKEITITNCPMMETFAVESCSTRMSNSIPKFFFSKEVTCPNLYKLVLYGIKTASVIFSPEFERSGLKVLEVTEPSPTRILPSLFEVVPEAEKGQTAAEQSRSMDSPLQVTVSVAGELSNYMDLKFETLYGLSSSKGQNATNEFNYCDFTSEADNYHILMRKKTSVKLPEHLIWNGEVTSLTSPPEEEKWRQACVMVLRDNSFHSLPEKPDYPNLVLLLLQRSICLREIPDSFFSLMPSLGILDLSDSRMSSLPSSLFGLHKLQVLILRNCKFLDKLPNEVKGLVLLEVLDLFGTELNDVPDEIGDLDSLRHLQLTFYGTDDESEYAHLPLNFFPQNIISRLQSLEALSIVVHPEDKRWMRNAEVIIQDVGKLEKLCYLEFYFPKVEILEQFTEESPSWKQIRFNKFKFVVGQNVRRFVDRVSNDVENKFNEQNRCLRFVNGNDVPQAVIKVLNHVTAVYLDHHLDILSLSELGITTSKELKFCTVRECPNVEVIIDDNNDEPTYPSLEHLGMHYLWKLERISANHPPKGSFTSLKSLIVDTCRSLKFIVYESMLQCLYNLEELVVEDCENVTEIVRKSDGMEKDVSSALPSLRKLRLHYLPKLSRFWWRLEGNLEDPVPEGCDVKSCPKLELSSLPSMAEDLKVVECEL